MLATVGSLPVAQSDVAVTAIGNTAYVVGGYDGVNWLDTILAYRPGDTVPKTAATLPVGLRYAAVAAVDGRVLIAGGSTPTAAQSCDLQLRPEHRKGRPDRDAATARDAWRTGPAWPVRLPGGW